MEEYKTFEINPNLLANARLAKLCEICLNPFEIWSSNDARSICPECRDRLYTLLYGESDDDVRGAIDEVN